MASTVVLDAAHVGTFQFAAIAVDVVDRAVLRRDPHFIGQRPGREPSAWLLRQQVVHILGAGSAFLAFPLALISGKLRRRRRKDSSAALVGVATFCSCCGCGGRRCRASTTSVKTLWCIVWASKEWSGLFRHFGVSANRRHRGRKTHVAKIELATFSARGWRRSHPSTSASPWLAQRDSSKVESNGCLDESPRPPEGHAAQRHHTRSVRGRPYPPRVHLATLEATKRTRKEMGRSFARKGPCGDRARDHTLTKRVPCQLR